MTPVIRYKAFFMQYYPCDLVNTFRPHLFSDIGHDLFIGSMRILKSRLWRCRRNLEQYSLWPDWSYR